MKTVANVIGVARSNLAARAKHPERRLVGRRPQPDEDLVGEIKGVIADLPTYGYRRVHAILRRRAAAEGRQPPNHKRVYAVMKRHGPSVMPVGPSVATTAASPSPSRTCDGVPMASR